MAIISSSLVSTLGFAFPFLVESFGRGKNEGRAGGKRQRNGEWKKRGSGPAPPNIRASGVFSPLTFSVFNEVLVGGVALNQPGGKKLMKGSDS